MESRTARIRHIKQTVAIALLMGVIGFFLTPLVVFIAANGHAPSPQTFRVFLDYVWLTFSERWWEPHQIMLTNNQFIPLQMGFIPGTEDPWLKGITAYAFVVTIFIIIGSLRHLTNQHKKFVMKSDARWCNESDLVAMEQRKQIGIKGGLHMALGIWPTGLRKNQPVRMIETLSALLLAPPGTGKTAGFVIPTLLTCMTASNVINDPKPELYQATGGTLEQSSFMFMLDWSKIDRPSKNLFYPRFNFLSKQLLPPSGPDRDTYIDAIAKTLIPEKQGGGDSYFVDKGRAALTGFVHHLVAKVNDAGNYNGIPEEWKGKEASLPMLVNWIAQAQMSAAQAAEQSSDAQDAYSESLQYGQDPGEYDDSYAAPPAPSSDKDPMSSWLRTLADEANPASRTPDNRLGTSNRAFIEFSTLVPMADKERSGVLGSMDQALIPFKNEAVMERTSATDFVPADLRGIRDPITGVVIPMNLFVCVNQAEADAFASITTLLYEVLAKYLISFGANEYDYKNDRTMGPCPVCFVMDEFAKLPRCDAVITIPDLGRSKQLMLMIVAQDYGQLKLKYSQEHVDVINTTTAVKIILAQNNKSTVELITSMVGKTTIRRAANSYQDGISKQTFSYSRSDTIEETDLIRAVDISSIPPGKHIVLVQNFMQRPMKLNTQFFFTDPQLADRVYVKPEPSKGRKGTGHPPTKTLPDFVKQKRLEEIVENVRQIQMARASLQYHTQETELEEEDAL